MLVVCGEAVIDLIGDGSAFGYQARPGGSPVNVAVGTARLQIPTYLLARFGSGRFGAILREHVAESGVDLSLSVDAAEPATLAVVSLAADGSASYDFYVEGTADWGWQPSELPDPLTDDVRALHIGSLASWRSPAAEPIGELVQREMRRGEVLISFDPNLRPPLVTDRPAVLAHVEDLVAAAHVVKVSAEDLEFLYPAEEPDAAALRWADLGPRLVVLTDGGIGARAYRPGVPAMPLPAVKVDVVDTVGAGDAFSAGLLAALADAGRLHPRGLDDIGQDELHRLLSSAGLVAALTCTKSGADPPTRAQRDAAATELH